jgi:hypothetical protein
VEAIRIWHAAASEETAEREALFVLDQLDPVQRNVCMELFRSYQTMVGRNEPIDFGPPVSEVTDSEGEWRLQSWPTAAIRDPSSKPEYLKLRTGRNGTSPEEAAVLLAGSDETAAFTDLLLTANDSHPIVVSQAERDDIIAGLFDTASRTAQTSKRDRPTRPGFHCYGCGRAPYCGEYPVVAGQYPGTSARLIMVSKSGLARASGCDRRGAWSLIHRIPAEQEEASHSAEVGLAVHQAVDTILAADDPAAALEAHLGTVPPSEVADIRLCVENHLTMDAEHEGPRPLQYRRRRFQTGITIVLDDKTPERRRQTAVVFLAEVDATARESSGIPALVEHKTGDLAPPFERDLYGVAGWHLLERLGHAPEALAVHHHHLRRQERPRCDRVVFDREAVAASTSRLVAMANRIAQWDVHDTLGPSPKAKADGECLYCEYRQRCLQHGGPPE